MSQRKPSFDNAKVRPSGQGEEPDFGLLFQAAPGAYLVLAAEPDFPIVAATDSYLSRVRRRREEITGRGIFEVFPDNPNGSEGPSARAVKSSLERVARTGRPHELPVLRYDVRRPDREGGNWEERYWKTVNSPVMGEDGTVAYILHHAEDITQRISLEEALEESDERLRFTLDAAGVGAWDLDLEHDRAERSLRHDEVFGYDAPLDEWNYQIFLDHVHPDDRERVGRRLEKALEMGGDWEFQCRINRADGQLRWIEVHGSPYAYQDGRPVRMLGLVEDITERKETEEALRRSRDRFRALVEATTSIVWSADPAGMVQEGSARWAEFTGLTPRECQGLGWLRAVHPDDRERVRKEGSRAIRERRVGEGEFRLRHRDGEYRYVAACGVPLREDGEIVEWIGTLVDVHDRKAAEEERRQLVRELRAKRNRLRQVFEQAPAGILVTVGPEHRIEIANPLVEEFLGEKELVGRTIREVIGEGSADFADVRDQVYASGKPYVGDEVCVPLGQDRGEERYLNFVYQPLFDAEGEVEGILTVAVDVTEQVLARWEVDDARSDAEAARDETESILESISDAFYAVDDEWRFIYVNSEAERLWRRPRETLLGRGIWEEFPETIGSESHEAHLMAAREARPISLETESEGLGRWLQINIYPGESGLTVFFRDITERRKADEERERLYQEADEANRAKASFLAVMSHELRTPLNAVVGFTELLQAEVSGPLTDMQRKHLERIRAGTTHLIQIIEEILTFSRAEAGREEVYLQPVSVADLVSKTAALVRPMAGEKGLAFSVSVSDDLPPIETDSRKLRQILLNLLSNAVKFTDRGGVQLQASDEEGELCISVKDTGSGIEPSEIERIFEPFRQVDQSSRRRVGGTGLGLAVTRQLVDLLDGTIEVESTPGEGSTFTVRLPRKPDPDPGARQPVPASAG